MTEGSILAVALVVSGILLAGAVLAGTWRLLFSPTVTGQVIAIDKLATTGVGVVATYAVFAHESALLDVALVIAVLGFLGLVSFGYRL